MTDHAADIEQILVPPVRDLTPGFQVRRALPSVHRRMVGPFVFLDQFGPVAFGPGNGLETPPHPHIGLSTVTYLLEGELLHRDSIGNVQLIRPGEVNVMTAGRGIVHSERSSGTGNTAGGTLFGVQSWIALPANNQTMEPAFDHIGAGRLPAIEGEGIDLRLIAGSLHGRRSPTPVHSDLFYANVRLVEGARFRIDAEHAERAIFVLAGSIEIVGQSRTIPKDRLVIFTSGGEIVLQAKETARLMVLGGEPLPEKRFIYWNFVSSDQNLIAQAADDWRARRFPDIPGETGFIALPELPPNIRLV